MSETLDQQWFGDFTQAAAFANDVDSHLRTSRADVERRQFFDSGCQVNPDLRPEVNPNQIEEQRSALTALRDRIGAEESDGLVRGVYTNRIDELLTNVAMLEAAGRGDTEGFIAANVDNFGEPDAALVAADLAFFHAQCAEARSSSHHSVREVARRVEGVLPTVGKAPAPALLTPDEFAGVQALYGDFFDTMMSGIVLPDNFGKEVSFPAARQAMANLGFSYDVVPQRAGVATMSVNHDTREFKIPEASRYSATRFMALLGHELRVHIEEAVEGRKQPLQLLYSGLRGALRGSEGKAVIPEQVVHPNLADFMRSPRGATLTSRHLTIGLARGADGNGPRDFVKVFDIMSVLQELQAITAQPGNPAEARRTALEKTWRLLADRAMRGCVGLGAAAHKDGIYTEGNAEALMALTRNPGLFPYLHIGKYNIAVPADLSVMQRIGAIPAGVL